METVVVALDKFVKLLAVAFDEFLLPARSNCIRIVKYDVRAPTICVIVEDVFIIFTFYVLFA